MERRGKGGNGEEIKGGTSRWPGKFCCGLWGEKGERGQIEEDSRRKHGEKYTDHGWGLRAFCVDMRKEGKKGTTKHQLRRSQNKGGKRRGKKREEQKPQQAGYLLATVELKKYKLYGGGEDGEKKGREWGSFVVQLRRKTPSH